jgi:hypothetical protein
VYLVVLVAVVHMLTALVVLLHKVAQVELDMVMLVELQVPITGQQQAVVVLAQ